MNKCIAFVDDDERFLEQLREHLTYRGYDVLGYRACANFGPLYATNR